MYRIFASASEEGAGRWWGWAHMDSYKTGATQAASPSPRTSSQPLPLHCWVLPMNLLTSISRFKKNTVFEVSRSKPLNFQVKCFQSDIHSSQFVQADDASQMGNSYFLPYSGGEEYAFSGRQLIGCSFFLLKGNGKKWRRERVEIIIIETGG